MDRLVLLLMLIIPATPVGCPESADEAAWHVQIKAESKAAWRLELAMMEEPRAYQSRLPESEEPVVKKTEPAPPKAISPEDRKR